MSTETPSTLSIDEQYQQLLKDRDLYQQGPDHTSKGIFYRKVYYQRERELQTFITQALLQEIKNHDSLLNVTNPLSKVVSVMQQEWGEDFSEETLASELQDLFEIIISEPGLSFSAAIELTTRQYLEFYADALAEEIPTIQIEISPQNEKISYSDRLVVRLGLEKLRMQSPETLNTTNFNVDSIRRGNFKKFQVRTSLFSVLPQFQHVESEYIDIDIYKIQLLLNAGYERSVHQIARILVEWEKRTSLYIKYDGKIGKPSTEPDLPEPSTTTTS